jgi:hypothetical protein
MILNVRVISFSSAGFPSLTNSVSNVDAFERFVFHKVALLRSDLYVGHKDSEIVSRGEAALKTSFIFAMSEWLF